MARILVDDEWFDQLSSGSLYESEFETLVVNNAATLFPEFIAVPFKCLLGTDDGEGVKADAALVSRDYRDWWVVEVELSRHSLENHVYPQVSKLSRALYSENEAAYLCARNAELDLGRVRLMMKGRQPRVLVIADAPCPQWAVALRRHDAIVAVCEVFRSRHNRHLFRVNGEHPTYPSDVLTECVMDSQIPRLLRILSPAALTDIAGVDLEIYYAGAPSKWKRIESHDTVWLAPRGPNELPRGKKLNLLRTFDGRLVVESAITPAGGK